MKKFVLIAVVLFATAFADSSESEESWGEDLDGLAKLVKNQYNITIVYEVMKLMKLVESKCPTIKQKITLASEEVEECIRNVEVGSDTLCSAVKKNWAKCTKPGVDAIASCLPEESKYFPMMIGKVIGAHVDHICGSTVEEVAEFFNPCMHEVHSRTMPECAESVRLVHYQQKDTLPSKDTICRLIDELRTCGVAHELKSCKNPILRRASAHLYKSLKEATKDECAVSNYA